MPISCNAIPKFVMNCNRWLGVEIDCRLGGVPAPRPDLHSSIDHNEPISDCTGPLWAWAAWWAVGCAQ